MSTPKRTITIDTNIQSLSKRGKNKSVKNAATSIRPKLKPSQFIRPSTLKKQLLARIKTHQQKKNTYSDARTLRDTKDSSSTSDSNNNTNITNINKNNNNNNNNKNNNSNNNINSKNNGNIDNESFSQSLEYLQSLAVNRKDRKHKTKTQRMNPNPNATVTVATHPPPQVFLNAFPSEENTLTALPVATATAAISAPAATATAVPTSAPTAVQVSVPVTELAPMPLFEPYVNNSTPIILNSEPQWGCLKSGNKPTFRSFHNKTCKVSTSIDPEPKSNTNLSNECMAVLDTAATNTATTVSDSESELDSESESERERPDPVALSEVLYGSRQQRLNDYRNEQVKNDKKSIEPVIKIKQTKQRIVTKKYKLGKYTNKTGPVIGVLIKNVQTQRNVERKRNEMKHIPLDTIISNHRLPIERKAEA